MSAEPRFPYTERHYERRAPMEAGVVNNIAVNLLARQGIATIWTLHVSAARAYGNSHLRAADVMIEIADAAEETVREGGLGSKTGY
jgi:hypothetical protein